MRLRLPAVPLSVVLAAALFASCAGAPPPVTEAVPPAETTPPHEPEREAAPPAVRGETPEEAAMRLVAENSPGIEKQYAQREDGGVDVSGLLESGGELFSIRYDLDHAEADTPTAGAGTADAYLVPFELTCQRSGETAAGVFRWHVTQDDAGLLLAFDDRFIESWRGVFDTLDAYGAKVTFFVQGPYTPFCAEAIARGHDVGYHSAHHLNLSAVPRETFAAETTADLESFRSQGVPLASFAYPYGLCEPWMHEALADHFNVLRGYGVTFKLYDKDAVAGYVTSKALDNTLFKEDGVFERNLVSWLRAAKFAGGVLPLTTHDIAADAHWGIKPERLRLLLRTANELKLKFYLYRDF